HVRHQPHAARPGDGADVVGDGLLDLVDQRVAGFDAGTERAVDLRHGALDVVGNGHHSGFADFRHGHAGGFDLLGAEAVAGDVDDVVDAAQHAHVAVLGDHGAVAGDVRPVAPVLAVLVAVLAVVGLDEALVVAPDGQHARRPRIADAQVAGNATARLHLVAVVVIDGRIHARQAGAGGARLHAVQARHGGAQEAAVLGLPPRIDDDRPALADDTVVPAPGFRLDGLTHRGHVLELLVVLQRQLRVGAAQRAHRGRRRVEDVDAVFLGDAPRPAGVRVGRHAFVQHRGGGQRQRPVDDVGVAGDPADVGHAPVD